MKAAADSGFSLLARGRVTVGRDREAPVSPGAAEGLLPRAGALSREGLAPETHNRHQQWAISSLWLPPPSVGIYCLSHTLAPEASCKP